MLRSRDATVRILSVIDYFCRHQVEDASAEAFFLEADNDVFDRITLDIQGEVDSFILDETRGIISA